MALKAVKARLMGDNYQFRFFWYQAAQLLLSPQEGRVERVALEHDEASGVDDVAVFYRKPGRNDGGRFVEADYFQTKYHVDQRSGYSSSMLIGSHDGQSSLLKRFRDGYRGVRDGHGHFRLNLVSNWTWASDDAIGCGIREDGLLPEEFHVSGATSELGSIREEWRKHLEMEPAEFEAFARCLCFGLNWLDRGGLAEALSDRLARVGLIPLDFSQEGNRYDDLAAKLIIKGRNEFSSETFRELCSTERLLASNNGHRPRRIGIRSFIKFAKNMESETDSFRCVAEHFAGRRVKDPTLWNTTLSPAIESFLEGQENQLRSQEHELLLDCHQSLAFLAGQVLNRKSGCSVNPIQKGSSGSEIWRPRVAGTDRGSGDGWSLRVDGDNGSPGDIVLAISVSNDVSKDVKTFLDGGAIGKPFWHVVAAPRSGIGLRAITDGDHAIALAEELHARVRAIRSEKNIRGRLHIFASAPNALMFFLGQLSEGLGPVTLYEYDFEGHNGGGYERSLSLR